MKVYTVCHSQYSDQGLFYLSFSAVWSRSTLSFSAVWSESTLFTIRSSLSKVKVILKNSLIIVYSICHSQPSDQHYLPFSVWTGSSLFAILGNLIRATLFSILSKQYYHVLKCFPFSALWSGSTLFFILSSLIRVYTVSHSQQIDQGLYYYHSQSDKGLHCLAF